MLIPIALLIATAFPLIFLTIIYTQDLYKTRAFSTVLLCFVWGVASFGAAWVSNKGLMQTGMVSSMTLLRYVAPVTEEIIKALILLYLVRRVDFTYFVDGAIFGFAVGTGFAIAENYNYVMGHPGLAITVAVGRVLSSNLIHATASSLIGVTLGLARFQRRRSHRLLYLSIGILLAVLVHSGFNHLVTHGASSRLLIYSYAAFAGIAGALVIIGVIRRGLAEERAWIEEMLGEADRITAGEAAVVRRLAEAGVILTPLVERLGEERAMKIGRMLVLQAQLGILRKTMQKLPDDEMREDVSAQIDGLRAKVDGIRQEVGAYAMLLLRSVFPQDNFSAWRRLEAVVGSYSADGGIGVAEMLTDLPPAERRLMRLILRHKGRMSFKDIVDAMKALPKDRRLSESMARGALDSLIGQRWLVVMGEAPVTYEENLGRRRPRELGEDIWSALLDRSAVAAESDTDVWIDLVAAIKMQAAEQSDMDGESVWTILDRRITRSLESS